MDNIKGKTIIITGASSGMGAAAASHLAQKGAKVILAARRSDKIDGLANQLNQQGYSALSVETDVTNFDNVQNLVNKVNNDYGKVDVLINNAGIMPLSRIDQLKINEWNAMIDVNIRGVLHGIAAVLPIMQKQGYGHIINTASVAAHLIFPASAVYSATKFAVRALTEGLRQEVAASNIRVTLISPGAVKTELLNHISDDAIKAANSEYVENFALPADSYARMVEFAINEPQNVGVNEIIFRSTTQEL